MPSFVGGGIESKIRLINDAAMQALGSHEGGRMLFLGPGTGFGSAMAANGIVEPMELGYLPVLAQLIQPELAGKTRPKLQHDSSTNALIQRYRKLKEMR